uniref:Uncharacterized protein n=1 Tax=Romanomermis culicivorax TaxID=13658 RepID=A0A915KB95_ROMCU
MTQKSSSDDDNLLLLVSNDLLSEEDSTEPGTCQESSLEKSLGKRIEKSNPQLPTPSGRIVLTKDTFDDGGKINKDINFQEI